MTFEIIDQISHLRKISKCFMVTDQKMKKCVIVFMSLQMRLVLVVKPRGLQNDCYCHSIEYS